MLSIDQFEEILPETVEVESTSKANIPTLQKINAESKVIIRKKIDALIRNDVAFSKRWSGNTSGLNGSSRSELDMAMTAILKNRQFSYSESYYIMTELYEHGKAGDRKREYFDQIWEKLKTSAVDEVNKQIDTLIKAGISNLPDYFELMLYAKLMESEISKSIEHLSSKGLGGKRDLRNDFNTYRMEREKINLMELEDEPIYVEAHNTPYTVDDICEREKDKSPPRLFVRGNAVCSIREHDAGTVHGITHKEKHQVIYNVHNSQAKDYLTREYNFLQSTLKGLIPVACPSAIAETLISRQGSNDLLPLAGIIHTPIMRPDGTILQKQGYDHATGLYLTTNEFDNINIPDSPSDSDIDAACCILMEPFQGFPFESDLDRAVILSSLFTVLLRPILRSAPLYLINATKMGTGKSLLVNLITMITSGKSSPGMMSYTDDENEMRKRCLASLIQGSTLACLDNIATLIHSDVLCILLTEPEFSDRILGKTEQVRVPTTSTTWFATGNAIGVSGDLSTRALICNLDAQIEKPEEREFAVNLYEWVPEHRIELVTAALTLLRAYQVADDKPKGVKPWGRFEDWSEYIRKPIIWLGFPDPYDCVNSIQRHDPVREELYEVLSMWHEAFGDKAFTVKEVISELMTSDGRSNESIIRFKHMLKERELDLPRKLGGYLSKHKGRIEDGYRVIKAGEAHKTTVWRVEKLSE